MSHLDPEQLALIALGEPVASDQERVHLASCRECAAEVEQSRDGTRTITVTLEGEAEADDYREVWLIRNDGAALISVGMLEGSSGSFPIPEGVDLAEYDLVDISFEPIDGNPAHSGDSIVRGQLAFV